MKLKVTTGILITLLLASMLGAMTPNVSANNAEWTFMVYMDADNNLDCPENFDLLMDVGSTDEVNIVVLWDGYGETSILYYDSKGNPVTASGSHFYYVVEGNISEDKHFPTGGKELNMGDPYTLKTFVDFTFAYYPADHYCLVLWDHGYAMEGCCWDWTNGSDNLTPQELVEALEGHYIDVIAWDACLQAYMEVVYEYAAGGLAASYLVGSEIYVSWYGFPYDWILQALVKNPYMEPRDFAVTIAKKYAECYRPRAHWNYNPRATLSVINLSAVEYAAVQLSNLTDSLIEKVDDGENYVLKSNSYYGLLSQARAKGNIADVTYSEYFIDLPSFAKSLCKAKDPDIREAAKNLVDALNKAIVYVGNTQPMGSVTLGLGIYFPKSYEKGVELWQEWWETYYMGTRFAQETLWVDLLFAYWNVYVE